MNDTTDHRCRRLRVVTWNIHFGENIDAAAHELGSITALRSADIILLQEMDAAGSAALADAIGADHVFASAAHHRRSGRPFGNAVLTPHPITASAEVMLPHTARFQGQPRSGMRASVTLGDHTISVYSVHTEIPTLPLRRRIEQFDRIAADVADRGAPLSIVGGDFNTLTPRGIAALSRSMAQGDLRRLSGTAGPTFRRPGQRFTLDHLFATSGQDVTCGVAAEATASDHLPLWVEFTLP